MTTDLPAKPSRPSAEEIEPAAPPLAASVDTAEQERREEERQRAVRLLLERPLVTDTSVDPESFAQIRRHAPELKRWFLEQLGYRLVVDPELARLHKRPAPRARLRPLRTRSGRAFDARRYALLCLVLAALERMEVQTVLSELAEQVALLAASEPGVRNLDLENRGERQAFVDAVRFLVDLGVLALTDGEDVAYVERSGDALYDIHSRLLSQVLSAPMPQPPQGEDSSSDDLTAQHFALDDFAYPDTDEGIRLRLRHRLMRRLVEEPVLHLDELEEHEREYLDHTRHYLVGQVERATGLTVEIRREGLTAVDPAGRLTDLTFPSTGTVAHAALLLAEHLAARGREARSRVVVPWSTLHQEMEGHLERYQRFWSNLYTEDVAEEATGDDVPSGDVPSGDAPSDGARRLVEDAVERLEAMGLVRRHTEGVEPRPAVARYRVVEREEDERDRSGGSGDEAGESPGESLGLFGDGLFGDAWSGEPPP